MIHSSEQCGHQTHVWYTYIPVGKTVIYKNLTNFFKIIKWKKGKRKKSIYLDFKNPIIWDTITKHKQITKKIRN